MKLHVISARASTGTVMNGLDTTHDLELTSTCDLREEFLTAYTCASGTSMSAPHVTGVVALMQERAGGTLSPDQVKEILERTADPMEGHEEFEVGAGMINAVDAVRQSKSNSGGKNK